MVGMETVGSGYQAGISDAQSEYQSNLVYSPHPSYCCHSQEWIRGFEAGYNYQWNLQEQTQVTKQTANVYIENSPGTQVNIGQSCNQGQDGSGPGGCCGP